MESQQEIPVLIVGGGAAGTMLALELARFGIKFRLIDRLEAPSSLSRAITVHARTLEILERIDKRLADRILDRGIHSPGYVIHYLDEEGQRSEVRPGLDFRGLDSRYPFLVTHGQNETEQSLRDYMKETFHVNTEWGVSCEKVEIRDNEVHAVLKNRSGQEEKIRCRYVVACDGVNSRIRHQLQVDQNDSGDYSGAVLQNLDVVLENFPDKEEWMHYCVGPGHFLMVAKLPSGYTRLLMSQPPDKAGSEEIPQQIFYNILSSHFDGVGFGDIQWHSRWQSHVKLAQSYRYGNIFLAGDAAHTHSTAGGQGMNCCIQDSYNLGWKMAMVLMGDADESLLDSYERERKPIGHQVITAATDIHKLFMTGKNEGPDGLRELQKSGFIEELVGRVSGVAYHYREEGQDLAIKTGSLQAGDRAPDSALVDHSAERLFDLTRHTKFTLLVMTENMDCPGGFSEWIYNLGNKYRHLLVAHQLVPGPERYVEGNSEPVLLLIRPDGYVAAKTIWSNRWEIEDWIQTQL